MDDRFGFGLCTAFGFSFALQETLQFAARTWSRRCLRSNVGVELGQLLC
jgi:hypothetical protein